MLKNIWEKGSFLFRLRLFLGLVILIIIFLFLYLKIIPFGHISYSRDYLSGLHSGKGFIYGFTPAERVEIKKGEAPVVTGDPIYFSVFTPRTFDHAKLTIVYRDNLSLETPIIEAGVLADNIVWQYNLQPLDNKALDYLMLRWHKSEEGGKLFLQKEKKYESLSAWEADLARGQMKGCNNGLDNCLAVYNYSPEYNYQIPNYQPALPVTLENPLRGAHQFYVYIKNEPLRLDFSFVDRNQDSKPAPISLILTRNGQIITTRELADPNLQPASGQAEEKELALEQMNLPAGVYKVEVKITDDMVIKKIVSSVNRLSFINKIWPVSVSGALNLYADSAYLLVKAPTPASLQTINFGGQNFTLSEAYRQYDFKTSANEAKKIIKMSQDNLILENNGVFAWSEASLFNPSLPKVDRYFSVNDPVEYIVANYKKPKEEEGIKTATAEFDLKGAYREKGKYSFMISVPGLKSEDGTKDNLEIYQIKIELNGRTLWQKIWQ